MRNSVKEGTTEINDQDSIAYRLRSIMISRNIRQTDIVKGIGASKSAVSKWLSGDAAPQSHMIQKLAVLLDVSFAWLSCGDDAAYDHIKPIVPIPVLSDDDTLANRIKSAMINKDVNKSALAKLVGTSRNTITSWLSGDVTPHFTSINKLADALDVSSGWLSNGNNSNEDGIAPPTISIAVRLNDLMYEKNIIAINLAASIGASRGAVSKWLSGDSIPSHRYIEKLATVLDTSYKWLAYGQLEPDDNPAHAICRSSAAIVKNPNDKPFVRFSANPACGDEYEIPHFKILYPSNQDIINAGKTDKPLSVIVKTPFTVKVQREVAERCHASMTDSFCYRNESDSMKPRVMDDALCIADRSRTEVRDGKIYVFRHGVTLKTRFLHRCADGSLIIRSQNDDYPNEIVPVDKLNTVDILGWVYCMVNEDI